MAMDFPHVVLARIYEHIEPIDRGERYEDPLQAALDQADARPASPAAARN